MLRLMHPLGLEPRTYCNESTVPAPESAVEKEVSGLKPVAQLPNPQPFRAKRGDEWVTTKSLAFYWMGKALATACLAPVRGWE